MADPVYDTAFGTYYDDLTRHKDYAAEVDTLVALIDALGDPSPRILDVGCGTGTHAALLAERGYDVTAVEPAAEMARQAEDKLGPGKVVCGEIAAVADTGFSFCVSLFNVVNCLPSLDALIAFLAEAAARMTDGGMVLVETWNPVAVIAEPPVVVERTYDVEDGTLRRTVVPEPDFLRQRLGLRYEVDFEDGDGRVDASRSFTAAHQLVLFTPLEVEFALRRAGFGAVEVRTALPDLAPATAEDRMLAFTATKLGHGA